MRSYRAKPRDGVAWVTGASSGIGRAVALELARRGYRVAVTARRKGDLEELVCHTENITSFPGDVTDVAAMRALVKRIERQLGPIALAFLNAGVYFVQERAVFSAELAWRTFEVNTGGVLNCLDPLLVEMRRRRFGQIVMNASLAAYGGMPGSLSYAASKAAVVSLAETLRMTEDRQGINVQVVTPGFVETAMTAHETSFAMPFLMDADQAATRICDGIEISGFEITFPKRLAWPYKFVALLPYPLYFAIMRWVTRRVPLG
ncbi:SDR family NAD(P)-dependent oxidoreductase [Beijerinckia mobilis]|uniref:SDR family NAD(P)-dependent oxidoreductase n=1 Tax=Beijerinckia mobilis TaxID=231434 RepID=UPI0005593908|nr:SDR family NAD(P)-dependent oxidoreductase [Beijerinckia mobilis]